MTFWKRQNVETVKRSVVAKVEGREGEQVEQRGFLGQLNYSVQYYNDGYISYMCPNP